MAPLIDDAYRRDAVWSRILLDLSSRPGAGTFSTSRMHPPRRRRSRRACCACHTRPSVLALSSSLIAECSVATAWRRPLAVVPSRRPWQPSLAAATEQTAARLIARASAEHGATARDLRQAVATEPGRSRSPPGRPPPDLCQVWDGALTVLRSTAGGVILGWVG